MQTQLTEELIRFMNLLTKTSHGRLLTLKSGRTDYWTFPSDDAVNRERKAQQ